MCVFHENRNQLTFMYRLSANHKNRIVCRLLKYFKASLTNSEDPDQTAHVGAV